jgi:hypothetical protein
MSVANVLSVALTLRAVATAQILTRAYAIKKSRNNSEITIYNLFRKENILIDKANKLEKEQDRLIDIENGRQSSDPFSSKSYEIDECARKKEKIYKDLSLLREKISKKIDEMTKEEED